MGTGHYEAGRTALLYGTRYKRGDRVDTSGWPRELKQRMEDYGRIVWVPDVERGSTPPPAATEPDDAAAADATDTVTVGTDSISSSGTVQVYAKGGGYYRRLDNDEKVDAKGRDAVLAAGYEIVEAPDQTTQAQE